MMNSTSILCRSAIARNYSIRVRNPDDETISLPHSLCGPITAARQSRFNSYAKWRCRLNVRGYHGDSATLRLELSHSGLPIHKISWYIAVNSLEGADADVHRRILVKSHQAGVPVFDSSSTWRFRC